MSYDSEHAGPRCSTLQAGIVTDNADPRGLYRVKISIPGFLDESDWAFPIGTSGGGSPQRGGLVVPAVGAAVGVLFLDGDVQRPFYLAGWWGGTVPGVGVAVPQPAKDAGAEAHKVASLQIGQVVFSVDERPGTLSFKVAAVSPPGSAAPPPMLSIELDLVKQGIIVEAMTAIILRTKGLIHLDAMAVRLRDRRLGNGAKPV